MSRPKPQRLHRFRPSGRRRIYAVGLPIAAVLATAIMGGSGGTPPLDATRDTTALPAAAETPPGSTAPEPQPGRQLEPERQPPSASGAAPSLPPVSGGSAGARLTRASVEPERLTGYVWPLRDGRITGFFAKRKDGFLVVDGKRIHEGLDVTTFCGDHVRAAHDGVVLAAGRRALTKQAFSDSLAPYYDRAKRRGTTSALSVSVVVDDGNGYRSVYAHLWDTTVRPGDAVSTGDLIGYEGATGFATGCHLHYELIRMDGPWMSIAPEIVERYGFPPYTRERIDPMRVFSLDSRGAPTYHWGVRPPGESPGLGRPTAPAVSPVPLEPSPEPPPEEEAPRERVSPGGS